MTSIARREEILQAEEAIRQLASELAVQSSRVRTLEAAQAALEHATTLLQRGEARLANQERQFGATVERLISELRAEEAAASVKIESGLTSITARVLSVRDEVHVSNRVLAKELRQRIDEEAESFRLARASLDGFVETVQNYYASAQAAWLNTAKQELSAHTAQVAEVDARLAQLAEAVETVIAPSLARAEALTMPARQESESLQRLVVLVDEIRGSAERLETKLGAAIPSPAALRAENDERFARLSAAVDEKLKPLSGRVSSLSLVAQKHGESLERIASALEVLQAASRAVESRSGGIGRPPPAGPPVAGRSIARRLASGVLILTAMGGAFAAGVSYSAIFGRDFRAHVVNATRHLSSLIR